HHRAGSVEATELHGALAEVRCLVCEARVDREHLQAELAALNPRASALGGEAAPDGDADLLDGAGAGFRVPDCRACGGILKPDVVFFGEAVPM
ncbi:MAG TPA: Sir2 family NAD-dependent protein deacetylase, partial [Myxococcota bacterium]|nr:Sir2 family NAD-dependent protein deacetylase [Myxococcota bacterium]